MMCPCKNPFHELVYSEKQGHFAKLLNMNTVLAGKSSQSLNPANDSQDDLGQHWLLFTKNQQTLLKLSRK